MGDDWMGMNDEWIKGINGWKKYTLHSHVLFKNYANLRKLIYLFFCKNPVMIPKRQNSKWLFNKPNV